MVGFCFYTSIPKNKQLFLVVARAISVTGMFFNCASFSAMCISRAGSFGRTFRDGSGLRYGQSVSSITFSSGTYSAARCASVAFLNVIMPVNEIKNPRSSIRLACSVLPLKQ